MLAAAGLSDVQRQSLLKMQARHRARAAENPNRHPDRCDADGAPAPEPTVNLAWGGIKGGYTALPDSELAVVDLSAGEAAAAAAFSQALQATGAGTAPACHSRNRVTHSDIGIARDQRRFTTAPSPLGAVVVVGHQAVELEAARAAAAVFFGQPRPARDPARSPCSNALLSHAPRALLLLVASHTRELFMPLWWGWHVRVSTWPK